SCFELGGCMKRNRTVSPGGARAKNEIKPSRAETSASQIGINQAICAAQTREGPCQNRPEYGRGRCRLHGGANGSGAPSGKRNGRYADGAHTKEARAERRWVRQVLTECGRGEQMRQGDAVDLRPDIVGTSGALATTVETPDRAVVEVYLSAGND